MFGEGVALRAALEELGLESAFERRDAPRDGGMVGPEPRAATVRRPARATARKKRRSSQSNRLIRDLPLACRSALAFSHDATA